MTNSKKRTITSSFGTSGRINHDAGVFYAGRLYQDQPQEKEVEYIEIPIEDGILNRIFAHTSEDMEELPDNSIHLMVTSPPYNVGKDYDQDLSLPEYQDILKRVWEEVYRVLVPGGRACINVANLGRKPYIPLHAYIIETMQDLGFLMRGEIIWNKAASSSASTAWGSWRSASNPTLRDVHEYILVFSKDTYRRGAPEKRENTIEKDQFLEYTKSVWTFPAVSAKKIGHPAPFPEELPARLIQLFTYADEIVLDPFMGSGQTAVAALNNGRNFVGYEIDQDYVHLAEERIAQATLV
ncbi:MAG: site-specific DNA-methyltransferase [Anaerolineales bacterium]|jgi:site-specific DNA-methyltransferase (adenine-specific)